MSKIMDTAEKEVIRREILELCRETQPYGAGRPALKAALRKSSYDVSDKELLTHGISEGQGSYQNRGSLK